MKTGTGVKTGGGAARRGRSAAEAAAVRAVKAAREAMSVLVTVLSPAKILLNPP